MFIISALKNNNMKQQPVIWCSAK